jgi:hypothetical protein
MTGSGGLASQNQTYGVSAEWARRAWPDEARYREMYARSVSDPNGFWSEQAKRIDWIKPFTRVENCSFAPGNISIKWFEDGVLNVAWNCIDRHLEKRGEQTAIIWKGDDPNTDRTITYRQLHAEVCKFANVIKRGLKETHALSNHWWPTHRRLDGRSPKRLCFPAADVPSPYRSVPSMMTSPT